MDVDQARALTAPLTAAERKQVKLAAAAAGKTAEEYLRDGITTAGDPFAAALERAAATIAGRGDEDRHDYATD
ncbi:hypothetical protein SAMN05216483_6658 [Streptomyces sp. 2131.1]|uniref:hypothetical protein n=1 Tax=Streptomyces sp. 2131.1 TaxID=1855346 RepID=UPI000898399D|nr:hypothetical protein [Streptomyces sp. 2131.1]SEE82284.1 hypothetical protein SAMN05216483_6658 [Streptomyces sp. 2131.1]